jgi:hypothetical protein
MTTAEWPPGLQIAAAALVHDHGTGVKQLVPVVAVDFFKTAPDAVDQEHGAL